MNSGTFDVEETLTIGDLSGTGGIVSTSGSGDDLTVTTSTSDVFAGVIQGPGALTVTGTGSLTVTGTNTYTGGTTIDGGLYQVDGSITGPVTVNSGTFGVGNTFTIGDLNGSSGTFVNLATGKTLTVTTSMPDTYAGVIQGGGAFTLTGTSVFNVSGVNTYTGGTTIDGGTFKVIGGGNVSPIGSVNLNGSSAIFDISTATNPITIGDLKGVAGTVNLGANSLTFGTANLTDFSGTINGTNTLTKQGSGTFIDSGVNNFTGTINVNSGEFGILGSFPSTSTMNVAAGAKLSGDGTLGTVNLNGTVAPGIDIGTLHTGNFTFNSGSDYALAFNDTTSDLIASTGIVTINGGTTLTLDPQDIIMPASSYTIITGSSVVNNGGFTLVNPFERFGFAVKYDPADVMLILTSVTPFFAKGNAGAAAKCFNTLDEFAPGVSRCDHGPQLADICPVAKLVQSDAAVEF